MTFKGPAGDLIQFSIGGGWGVESEKSGHSEVAVIRGTDIPKIVKGDFSSVPRRFESDKKLVNRRLNVGDIVLETAGGSSANGQYTGRTLLISEEILTHLGPSICASFCKRLVLDSTAIDPEYFYWYMQDLYSSGRIAVYDSQSTGLSNFQFASFLASEVLELPGLTTQRRVARFLSSLNQLMRMKLEVSKSLEEIAQTIFRSWFIDFDPVRAKMVGEKPIGMDDDTAALFPSSMEDSELGQIPSDWGVGSIGSIATLKGGKQLVRDDFVDDGQFPIFGGAGVMGYTNSFNSDGFVITLGRVGAHCGQFFSHRGKAWVNNNATRVEAKQGGNDEWLFLTLKAFDIETIKKGAAQPFVANSDVAESSILIPPQLLIEQFTARAQPMFILSEKLRAQTIILMRIRDALLPRLISGEFRIEKEMLVS